MPDAREFRKAYAKYRLSRAKEDLDAAHLLYENGSYRIANKFDDYDSSKHSGIIAEFRRKYIKEDVFPASISKMIGSAFTIRNSSDYDDLFVVSKADTEEQIANADYIYTMLADYVIKKLEECGFSS